MKTILRKTKGFRVAVISILTFVTLIISCWQWYKSTSTQDLAGAWEITFVNESSSYKPYIGETHMQKVFFSQNAGSISGSGEKWEYNGKLLPFDQHRKIEYVGTLDGNLLKATFKLYGLRRESSGSIDVELFEGGKRMVGRFMGTAGDTRGSVAGEKVE